MASTCVTPTCADACTDVLPEVEFSICAPEVNPGEIEEILATNIGNPLSDENDAYEWAARKALPSNDPEKIISLFCKAEKPAAETIEVEISRNTKVNLISTHKISGQIYETNQANYDALRALECPRKLLIWYRTSGGLLYGGAYGIEAIIKLKEVIPGSRKEVIYFDMEVSWEAKFSPCRTTSPF